MKIGHTKKLQSKYITKSKGGNCKGYSGTNKKCKTCMYRALESSLHLCDYASITGNVRGGEPGDKCIKYKKGPRLPMSAPIAYSTNSTAHSSKEV